MRYLAFLIVMGLSIAVVRRFDWPTWLQVAVVVLVNLVIGGAIIGTHEEGKQEGKRQ
jgi:protein-S-isoprenylcysteine O-methyltransferase Ste14